MINAAEAQSQVLSASFTQSREPVQGGDGVRGDFCEYVAQLQLHMTLQARNLLPGLTQSGDRRVQLLQETQAIAEKLASRQRF